VLLLDLMHAAALTTPHFAENLLDLLVSLQTHYFYTSASS
jgi:hypothetical protein